jgi:hypothetical protein
LAVVAVTGIYTWIARRLQPKNGTSYDAVVAVLHDIAETLESIDSNAARTVEWQLAHENWHDLKN